MPLTLAQIMLEEYDKIDTITSDAEGIQLVVMDAGLTEDPDERYDHLINKLRSYVAYATSLEFREKYPYASTDNVSILVMCRIPPTEKMLNTTAIARADNQEEMLQIHYRHFPGADADAEPKTESRRETPRALKVVKSSNIPVHITFGSLFLYLAATRYLIYFGPASEMHSFNPAQALGAFLGYLLVWSFGYWLCATPPRKTLVTWLGAAAVILSTLVGSLIGYVLLFVIYFIRRKQRRAN